VRRPISDCYLDPPDWQPADAELKRRRPEKREVGVERQEKLTPFRH
jgi:hypothetical protein